MSSPVTDAPEGTVHLDLELVGMTCAACAARIEKKLNKLDGVTATVNYATERATVSFADGTVTADQLVDAVTSIGYGAHLPEPAGDGPDASEARVADLRRRLLVAAVLGAPVLVLSMVPALQFRGWQWVALVLATPVAAWAALPFHTVAWRTARQAEAGMDTLISVGVLASYGWSLYALLATQAGDLGMTMQMSLVPSRGDSHHLYFEVASTTVALILAGRYFEARAKRKAGGALRALLSLGADTANVIQADGSELNRPVSALHVGDRFVVRPGERIATDGVVEDGASAVDASLVTGESLPVDVGPGDPVTGATINTNGRLVVRATRVGADTALAQMARLVEAAQSGKAPVQRLADRVAAVFVPVVIVLAVGTWGFWTARTGSITEAIGAGVAVLIIACPCALGLATPTALLVGTGRGAQMGILIKGPEILESTRQVDTIVLDKTGTVTTGTMTVAAVRATTGTEDGLLALAAAVEAASEHPIAKAVVAAARDRELPIAPVDDFRSEAGVGASGTVEGQLVQVGRAPTDDGHAEHAAATLIAVTVDGQVHGTIAVADTVKESSAAAIARLRRLGLRPWLLTGDRQATAEAVAAEVGIDPANVIAGVLPDGKVAEITRLQGEGRVVAMVGDGVNDAAALAQADLGIAMGTGTDVAIEASDLTLVRPDLHAAADAIQLSRHTLAVIKGNLFWAFAYNVAAIPLAMAWLLSPVVASAAMAFSSVFVVSNSLRLRRFRAGA
ncbi:MAG: cadmium-translocating P-type ATPase [Ilumatobacteraceae bacterium]|nr:cadmium-translocating P-type ATPase [Ilumatobacteraceae bacterium]